MTQEGRDLVYVTLVTQEGGGGSGICDTEYVTQEGRDLVHVTLNM